LHLASIKLTHFKNYEAAQLHFSPTVNCIVGLNGMGKTNLLDAIYYLCMCKSNFGITDRLVVKDSTNFFRVEGTFSKEKKNYKVVAKVQPKSKKEIEINGAIHSKLADHIGLFPVVMITPFDIELAMDGSEVRRKFLDNSLAQIDRVYLTALLQYNRILRQRNATLKSANGGNIDYALLDTLDEQLLNPTAIITQKRKTFCESFLPVFQKYYKIISNEQEPVDCVYRSQLIGQELSVLLQQHRERDVYLQRSTVGVHKDDLIFTIKEKPLKKFASQGQLKSYILALKLAQYHLVKSRKDSLPILLLDDIFDKLDNNRVQQLLTLLFSNNFGQIFFTDTHEERLLDLLQPYGVSSKRFIIEEGVVKE